MGLIKRVWIWVLAIVVVVGVFAAFRLSKKTDPEYFTAKVEKGDIRQVIEATGTINPVTSVQVGSQVSGMISKLYVDFNSKVTKGQVIAEIDPKLFEGAVLQAQADLQNSQALLAAAKANLTKDQATQQQNKLDYDRAVGLQRQGVNSQQQLDQAKATYDAITAQVGSDRAAIQQAEAQVAQKTATLKVAQTNLDYTIIRAPINGTVVARNIDIGQTVAASLQAPTLFMLVSVTERTREIGVRLAIGATEADIQFQFLAEAVAISILGGLLGVVAGVGASSLFRTTLQWEIQLTPQLLISSGLFAAGIGIFFGYYPSRKASQLNPIEALRYE